MLTTALALLLSAASTTSPQLPLGPCTVQQVPARCGTLAVPENREGGTSMTVIWFVIWLVANTIGDHEPLLVDPVNGWAATLILAVALDINRPQVFPGRKSVVPRNDSSARH
jgi:hypothetical protein